MVVDGVRCNCCFYDPQYMAVSSFDCTDVGGEWGATGECTEMENIDEATDAAASFPATVPNSLLPTATPTISPISVLPTTRPSVQVATDLVADARAVDAPCNVLAEIGCSVHHQGGLTDCKHFSRSNEDNIEIWWNYTITNECPFDINARRAVVIKCHKVSTDR